MTTETAAIDWPTVTRAYVASPETIREHLLSGAVIAELQKHRATTDLYTVTLFARLLYSLGGAMAPNPTDFVDSLRDMTPGNWGAYWPVGCVYVFHDADGTPKVSISLDPGQTAADVPELLRSVLESQLPDLVAQAEPR